ncbi:MAG: PepSY domain-containing protein [Cellvibrio sp.]|uniref:PepSY domain-containing protein n=1 Tax=Cellvibrio sp. TaxID=1965322 RepID=UPI0027228E42|nr:PepSY domain-containing protein [Cellvibrio sp.]
MKTTHKYLLIAGLITLAGSAQARDLGPDEALKLRDSGTIQSFEKLNELALAQHPGGVIRDTELENALGRYIYQLEVVDAQGIEWDLELDATNGQILKNHQDD